MRNIDGDNDELDSSDRPADLTAGDQRTVRAMITVNTARTGVVVLRVIAAVVVLAAVIGTGLVTAEFASRAEEPDAILGREITPDHVYWAQFLLGIATPIAFAGMIVAASYLLSVYAARLELEIAQTDPGESGENSAD